MRERGEKEGGGCDREEHEKEIQKEGQKARGKERK